MSLVRQWTAVLIVVCAVPGASARAQFFYPPGFGGWGWGGWGGMSTIGGDVAHGMGIFAAGAGMYNQQSAVARSIDADTEMRWNTYWSNEQQVASSRLRARMVNRQQTTIEAQKAIQQRIRENPTPTDIQNGNALNAILDEVTRPPIYFLALKGSKARIGGEAVRNIPFQYAVAAITYSVHDLTRGEPPRVLRGDAFTASREAVRTITDQLLTEAEERGELDPKTIQQAKERIRALRAKVEATIPAGTQDRRDADRHLKALMGLARMLDTPALEVLLAGVEKRPDTTLGELLAFMSSFNLRFGAARTSQQRVVYNQLFPLLAALRTEVQTAGTRAPSPAPSPGQVASAPQDFFEGMEYEHVDPKKAPPPPGPKPN
jgi:hypothetical protein